MYILVKEEDVKNVQLRGMFHERMPDGRLIMPVSELKMLGSVADCQIVASAKEMKELIRSGAESIPPEDGVQGNDNAPDGSENTDTGGNTEEVADRPEEAGDGHTDVTDIPDNAVNAGTGNNTGEAAGDTEDITDGQTVVTDVSDNINENMEE